MFNQPTKHISPKLEARTHLEKGGYGVFATEPIQAGELLIVWGGYIVSGEVLEQLSSSIRQLSIQVEENLYMVPTEGEPADCVNHSCNPNAGISGQIALVAMCDIAPGEEVCYDYAMSDGSPYDEFECTCGVPNCRGRVTGDDWRCPELWERYSGYFSPYLQRRINQLQSWRMSSIPINVNWLAKKLWY